MNNLPDDMIWEIYRKLHRLYMIDIIQVLPTFTEDFFDTHDPNYTPSEYSTDSDTWSVYSEDS
jgi:hypothetical protein